MTKPPIIDTVDALKLVHSAYQRVRGMPDTLEMKNLFKAAASAHSALMPYIKNAQAPMQQKHYDAIETLRSVMGGGDG